ncbi:MAG: hypothetical protein JRJ19_12505 [Deltaproteobacteria bacterium]|nr:hypothetical protein [Deltaproteobacteria bacterium]
MRTTVFRLTAISMLWIFSWCIPALADQPIEAKKNPNAWIEKFENPFKGWRDRFFYKHTGAESYYVLCGHKAGYRPSEQKGMWIGVRGKPATATTLTLPIKPSLGLEASYFSLGVNSHLPRLTITFIDKDNKTIAVSCAPTTSYYVYVPMAVRIKNGLKAIRFDGHGSQVSGNVNINNIEVLFGQLPTGKDFIIHEMGNKQCHVIPAKKQ